MTSPAEPPKVFEPITPLPLVVPANPYRCPGTAPSSDFIITSAISDISVEFDLKQNFPGENPADLTPVGKRDAFGYHFMKDGPIVRKPNAHPPPLPAAAVLVAGATQSSNPPQTLITQTPLNPPQTPLNPPQTLTNPSQTTPPNPPQTTPVNPVNPNKSRKRKNPPQVQLPCKKLWQLSTVDVENALVSEERYGSIAWYSLKSQCPTKRAIYITQSIRVHMRTQSKLMVDKIIRRVRRLTSYLRIQKLKALWSMLPLFMRCLILSISIIL